MKFFLVYKDNGLYDPVLDDYDPIYETIDQDQEDFDQPSQPTEVFQIKQFTETPIDLDTERDLSRSRTVSLGGELTFNELRALSESPFVLPTKPYRPFSTGPSPVPPLETPIILNPNYHDEFPKVDGIGVPNGLPEVDEFEGFLSEQSRFKLPISKQYDPDGNRIKKTTETTTVVKTVEERTVKEEIVTKEVKVTSVEERSVNEKKQKARFTEKKNAVIDLDKIEMTATSIVDESIEKAITVAGEIKKEMELELSAITSESKFSSSEMMESTVTKATKKELSEEKSKLIGTDVVTKKSDVSVAKEVAKFEKDDREIIIDERKDFMKQELEETIESGSVRRKSELYDKELATDVKIEKKSIDEAIENGTVRRKSEMYENEVKQADTKVQKQSIHETIESGSVRRKSEMFDRDIEQKSLTETKIEKKQSKNSAQKEVQKQSELKRESVSKTTESIQKCDESKTKEVKYSTAKLLAEQRAYTIGLQTIPHIRGTVQSSYHYDLLLKTFFIHLTDVMVALSRFILAEPVLSKSAETKSEVKKEVAETTRIERDVRESKTERVEIEDRQIRDQETKKVTHVIKQDHANEYVERMKLDHEDREKAMLSGAEMAQLSEKRSVELINKMDGVITEFQTKAGLEEEIIAQRDRRSRSRSRVDDEIIKESKPLEVISKVENKTQELTEVKTTSNILESKEMKTETRHESKDIKRETKYEIQDVNRNEDKNTYISICEAHVYTNKNSIFDETTEISESASVESIKETNIAREANEAMVSERVAIESQKTHKMNEAEPIVESYLSTAKTAKVIIQEKIDITEELDVHKSSVEVEDEKKVKVEILKTIEPIVELHEDIVEKSTNVVRNKMDIQEIETSEYIEESNVIQEESVQIVKSQDIQEIRGEQDVKFFEETNEVKIVDDIPSKIKEDVSIKIEEMNEVQDEFVLVKERTLEIVDVQESVSSTKEEVKDMNEEIVSVQEEAKVVQDMKVEQVAEDIKFTDEIITIKSGEMSEKGLEVKDEFAHLKVTKEEITEVQEDVEINQEVEVNIKKSVHISESDNKYQCYISESSIENAEYIQESSFTAKACQESSFTIRSSEDTSFSGSSIKESSFTAKSTEDTSITVSSTKESSFIARSTEDAKKQLTLDLDSRKIRKSDSESSVKSTISTPTPSTVPPTPLTDEYVFRLQIPLPKVTVPVPRSPSPEDEDPHIVKKNLVPHIDTEIIEEIVYETPLPTPPEDKTSPPKFTKPGLKGGDMRRMVFKEEIKEIERKSSLLASAIDQTIKSIEEYKEEVGIDNNTGSPVVYNGFAKVVGTKVYKDKLDEVNVEKQIVRNTENINKLVQNRTIPENTVDKVHLNGKSPTMRATVENNVANSVTEASESKMDDSVETVAVDGYRPVPFNPEDAPHLERVEIRIPGPTPSVDPGKAFVAANGEIMGTHQGIVNGLGEAVVDSEAAKEFGKPGMTEEKIAELISGESEMLREAHVMGLSRVLKSHMHRDNDDSSVDFKKIKPIVESLKDSEVLKALNEEFMKTQEEKKKEERKWTKFLQKPTRPVPKPKFGYHGWTANDEDQEPQYKPKIVKQPKPKVAPDYKPQDFNTGPLPWEERALNEPPPPPVEPEPPILVPEETPVFLEAVDPLPESEIPDLEETGIDLPPEKPIEEPKPEPKTEVQEEPVVKEVKEPKKEEVPVAEEKNNSENEMENRVAEQLIKNVEGMVDPHAPLEQQLAQMRAQLAALAQLPAVIQHTLELVSRQLTQITHQESQSHQSVTQEQMAIESSEVVEESNENSETTIEDVTEETKEESQIEEVTENGINETETGEEVKQVTETKVKSVAVEREKMKREEQEILDEQRRIEKQKKELTCEMLEQDFEEIRQYTPHEIAVRFVNELMDNLQLDKQPRRMQRPSLVTPSVSNGSETESSPAGPKEQSTSTGPKEQSTPTGPKKEDTKELMADLQLDQEARQLKQRPTPRVGKPTPKPVFGPLTPAERPVVLPGGRKWRKPKDAYNDQFIAETLTAQAELIQGKALGVNFMKYEKPPITLDHLQHSDVYKMIHGMEQEPVKRVEMLTPVIAEADYREKCRSVTPGADMGR